MSPEQYRFWKETGKKPLEDEQAVISGEGRPATNAVKPDEPSTQKQTTGVSAEMREVYAASGTYAPGIQDMAANERFARASDRRHRYDSGRPSAEEMAKMSPIQRFTVWLEKSITLQIENVLVTFPEGNSEAVCPIANVLVQAGAQLVGSSQVPRAAEKPAHSKYPTPTRGGLAGCVRFKI
jgi:hypothetical protein